MAAGSGVSGRRRKATYHHGNLRDALVDVAIELVAEHGVASFSLAEACRRLDVTVAAPYRHFADRDALLSAIAIRGGERLAELVTDARQGIDDPAEQLVAVTSAYVEFAAREPALFETMFTKEMLLASNPELAEAMRPVVEGFALPAQSLPGVTPHQAISIVLAAASTAHGFASFLRAGSFNASPDAVHAACLGAASTTRAIIAGRSAFDDVPEGPEIRLAGLTPQEWLASQISTPGSPSPQRSDG